MLLPHLGYNQAGLEVCGHIVHTVQTANYVTQYMGFFALILLSIISM